MRKACLLLDYHLNNKIFDLDDPSVNRDNAAHWFWLLKSKLLELQVDLATYDINSPQESEIHIYFDVTHLNSLDSSKKNFLFLLEPATVKPKNWILQSHKSFDAVFTWNDDLVGASGRYKKIYYSLPFPANRSDYRSNLRDFSKKKFCCLIAGNKMSSHKAELYSERRKVIRWFERHKSFDFDLFGPGWDRYVCRDPRLTKIISRLGFSKMLGSFYGYPSYRGVAASKIHVLREYKFSICFENEDSTPGYITEKIFDCFFAGCVPVYRGASNIESYVPSSCFIDARKFPDYSALNSYLENITDSEYRCFVSSITNYLFSEQAHCYSSEHFASSVSREIALS